MRITMYKLWYLLFANLFVIQNVYSFNFDTDFPIIYSDPYTFNGNSLEKDSYFGYSVLLYGGSNQNEPWIQIGAPRGLNPVRQNKSTGVVFRCGIKSTCFHIPLNSEKGASGVDDEAYFGNVMDINSDSNMYAVCGHRWIHVQAGLDYYMQGACFSGRTNTNKTDFFTPLKDKDDQSVMLPNNKRVYNKAQAQIGFSAQFVQVTKNDTELLVGLPGFLNWKGVPGLLRRQYQPNASRRRRRRDLYDFAENKIPNGQLVNEINYFDLGGYSVTSGKFFNDRKLYFVTGAPRANMKGSVLIFEFRNEGILVKDKKDGTSFGEYFGSAITASDINGDGLDDLIVGAPFHKSPGSDAKFDDGAIYVYLGSEDKLIDAVTNVIEGKSSGGRFGESVMSLGDIDMDGYADIAVAAPYENDNSGVVYIYRGNARAGLIKEPSQIIAGKSIIPNVKGFGISLSKTADVDGNHYNDFAIGAYKSGHVVLLRAKPVVTLKHNFFTRTSQITAKTQTEPFIVHSCVGFEGTHIIPPIQITRDISVDPENPGRAAIVHSTNYNSIMHAPLPTEYCENFTIQVSDSNKNIYNPVVIKASLVLPKQSATTSKITVTDAVDGTDGFCKTCPVIGRTSDATQQINVDFNRGCPNNVCKSVLNLSANFVGLKNAVYVIGSMNYVTLEVTVKNTNENAFQTEIHVTPPNPVRLRSIPSYCKEVASTVTCSIDNPLEKDATRTISLEMDFEEVNSGLYENILKFPLKVTTTSENNGDTEKTLQLNLVKNAAIELIGKSNEETYSYKNRTYGKATFQQTYKIMKHGTSPINKVTLYISIPRYVSTGGDSVRFLSVYSPEGTLAGQSITCSSNIAYVVDNKNVVGVGGDMDKKKRKRRDTTAVENQLAKYPSNRTIYMNCSSEDITCDEIRCNMGPFKNAKHVAEIKLKMDLDVSGLTGYMAEKDIFIVSTNARFTIEDKVNLSHNFSQSISLPSVFIGPSAEQSVATWIIIIAIICGILLLLLLAGILYKLGFFKRTKKEMLINEKAKQNGEDQREPLHDDDAQ